MERGQSIEVEPDQEKGWWTRQHVAVLVLLGATVVALSLCYLLARPFLPALAWALALAVVAHPLHTWLSRRVSHPNVAAGLAVAIVAILIVVPSVFVGQKLVKEASAGIEMITRGVRSGEWKQMLERFPRSRAVVEWFTSRIEAEEGAKQAAAAATQASGVVMGSIRGAMELLITFFVLFYFFRDRRAVLETLRSLSPLTRSESDQLFARVTDTIYATIYGTVAVSLVQGALGGLMFWWLGLPTPLLWGVIMALLGIIPILGAFVVWLPASIFLAVQGDWTKALILLGWGLFVISFVDNLLYPVLVGKRMRIHTLPVFIAVIGGLFVFGTSGVVLGPVVLAVTVALFDVWSRRTRGGRSADEVVT
jgi:predicted PurR-regulated permease PerM